MRLVYQSLHRQYQALVLVGAVLSASGSDILWSRSAPLGAVTQILSRRGSATPQRAGGISVPEFAVGGQPLATEHGMRGVTLPSPSARLSQDSNILRKNFTDCARDLRYSLRVNE